MADITVLDLKLEKLKPAETCLKCEGNVVVLKHYFASATSSFIYPEHIAVCCSRCGSVWERLPLDAKEKKGDAG